MFSRYLKKSDKAMEFFHYESLLNLFTLTGLEIILGIDNVIFIALLVQHLDRNTRKKARFIGLSLALIIRVLMLFCATWIMKLTYPILSIFSFDFSGRSILFILGGLFLLVKAIIELIEMFHEKQEEKPNKHSSSSFSKTIAQIIFIDIILSFDSIITAVGISNDFTVMVAAIVISMIVMLVASNPISDFIYKHPSVKVLALAFIALVGVMLVLNGFDIHFDKAYLYFAMFFSGLVEVINIRLKKQQSH